MLNKRSISPFRLRPLPPALCFIPEVRKRRRARLRGGRSDQVGQNQAPVSCCLSSDKNKAPGHPGNAKQPVCCFRCTAISSLKHNILSASDSVQGGCRPLSQAPIQIPPPEFKGQRLLHTILPRQTPAPTLGALPVCNGTQTQGVH